MMNDLLWEIDSHIHEALKRLQVAENMNRIDNKTVTATNLEQAIQFLEDARRKILNGLEE